MSQRLLHCLRDESHVSTLSRVQPRSGKNLHEEIAEQVRRRFEDTDENVLGQVRQNAFFGNRANARRIALDDSREQVIRSSRHRAALADAVTKHVLELTASAKG